MSISKAKIRQRRLSSALHTNDDYDEQKYGPRYERSKEIASLKGLKQF